MDMHQTAPFPTDLGGLVQSLTYKAGWSFRLEDIDRGQGSAGLTFIAQVVCPDSYHPDLRRAVAHYFIVPAAAYDERSWRRWLFDRIRDIETHEAMEFFQIDGERPYAPNHGPGRDPYTVHEIGTDADRRTSFRGEVKP